jgi:nucleoside-diphosphate-sugar epimerase
MKALVTGGSGFIGSKLVERLVERGDDVTCLVRTTSDTSRLKPFGVRLVEGDIRDIDAIDRAVDDAEIVYHLAGLATAFDPRELARVNIGGFQNLVTACAARETPPVLVSVSSLAAAGPSQPERPRVESDPPRPVSNYGRTKRAAEIMAASFAARVPITVVRPPIVFGEGDLQMRDVFRSIFRYGVHLALGVSRSRYSLIHVNDLVEALILCGQRGTRLEPPVADAPAGSNGYYFVAGDEQPTFTELGRMIANCLGRQSVRVLRTSGPTLLWMAASLAEIAARLRGTPYIFNFDKAREASAGNWTCSSAAIRGQLGFAPRASIVERLRQTSDWYRQQNML